MTTSGNFVKKKRHLSKLISTLFFPNLSQQQSDASTYATMIVPKTKVNTKKNSDYTFLSCGTTHHTTGQITCAPGPIRTDDLKIAHIKNKFKSLRSVPQGGGWRLARGRRSRCLT